MDNTPDSGDGKTVKLFRLINGDDLISEVVEVDKKTFVLVNPMKVIIDADIANGRQTIYMHNYMPQGIAKKNSCTIKDKDVLFEADVEEDIIEYYASVVFEMLTDLEPTKEKSKKEYMDSDKKIISLTKRNKKKPKEPN